jgi:MFS family permease
MVHAGVRSDKPVVSRWLILAVLFVARTAMGFQFQSIGALGPALVDDLAIDFALLGTLVGLYLLPGVVFALPGGLLGQRFGDRRITVLALALMTLGGFWVALSDAFLAAAAGRVVSGAGAVLLTIHLTKMTADWFIGREMVTAMALLLSSWPIGIGLALVVLPPVAAANSTTAALMATVLLSAVGLALILTVYRPPPDLAVQPMSFRLQLTPSEWVLSLLSGTIWGLFNVGFILVLTFGPSFLAAEGYGAEHAAAKVSLVSWTILVSLPLGGVLAERLKRPNAIMAGCFLAAAGVIAMLPGPVPSAVLFAAIGLLCGPPAGLIMKLPTEVLKPENRAAGIGLHFSCYFIAMAGLVPLAGVLLETTQSPSAPLMFAATMLLGATACLAAFMTVRRRCPGF